MLGQRLHFIEDDLKLWFRAAELDVVLGCEYYLKAVSDSKPISSQDDSQVES